MNQPPLEPTTPENNKLNPKPSKKPLIISIIVVVALLGVVGLGVIGDNILNNSKVTTSLNNPESDGNETVTTEESNIAAVAEKVSPSVVSVMTETRTRSYYGTTTAEGAGTGIIVSKDGYVLTNNHVVEDATSVAVVDNDGIQYDDVTIVGRDPLNDIAFLKIKSDKDFTAAELGNSSTIRIGQQVVAIGNALGQFNNTVTAGIISGVGRPITASSSNGTTESLTDLIQTDASINSGNSGGPLVNMSGQVIGINTAIIENANGLGFSIPINSTKGVLAGVIENNTVERAYLGINYLTITPEIANRYNLDVTKGAYIYAESGNAIVSNGPASQSGLKQGDIITKINDETIGTTAGLGSTIGQYRPGDVVTVTFLRDGKEQTTRVTLGKA